MCTVQTAHGVTRSLNHPTTKYLTCMIISDPLHHISYFYYDPHRCTLCHNCHLHTTRQENISPPATSTRTARRKTTKVAEKTLGETKARDNLEAGQEFACSSMNRVNT
jgi:hypothetical protein